MSGSTASIAATSPLSACVSDVISTSNSRPSRTLMIATPWSPIGPDRISDVAGRRPVRGGRHAVRHDADARGVDEQPVRGPAAHDLGVAGDDPRARLRRRGRRRRRDESQLLERQPLLDDVGEADRDRGRAHHREVVERAVDGELADVPAREPDRRDDVRVRGEREARAGHLHDGRVVEDAAGGGDREGRRQHLAHQRVRQLAARPVAQDDPLVLGDRGWAVDAVGVDGDVGCSRAVIGVPPGRSRAPPARAAARWRSRRRRSARGRRRRRRHRCPRS